MTGQLILESRPSSMKMPSAAASVIALILGLAVGSLLRDVSHPAVNSISSILGSIAALWVRALQMIVLPLVITQLISAVLSSRNTTVVGRMVVAALVVFFLLLALGAIFTVSLATPLMQLLNFNPELAGPLKTSIPQNALDAARSTTANLSFSEWLIALVPTNPFRAAVNGDLLQVILFTLFFALAITQVAPARRQQLTSFFEGLAETLFVMVCWLLRFTAIGVFAVAFSYARETGLGVAGLLLKFAALLCCLLVAFTLLLYPIAILLGQVSLRSFAQSLYPAQVVAVSTRSSLASLPALMEGAKLRLDVPSHVLGFSLPFSASVFKVNRTISGPAGLIFLAYLYDIHLQPLQILSFVLTVMILSFSSPGIPSGGDSFKTLPAYLAAGIPIEGVVLIKAVDVIPDIFKTLANVTGYMTVAVLLGRLFRKPAEIEPSTAELSLAAQEGAA